MVLSSFLLSFYLHVLPCLPVPSLPPSLSLPPGLCGGIAYALALNLKEEKDVFATKEVIKILDTATLIIVLFIIIIFSRSTLSVLKVNMYMHYTHDIVTLVATCKNIKSIYSTYMYAPRKPQ